MPMIEVANLSKSFTLHTQGGTVIEVMRDAALTVAPGECVALTGVSGAGKSTLMRMIWGNYRADAARSLWAAWNSPGRNPAWCWRCGANAGLCQPVPACDPPGAHAAGGGRAASGPRRRHGRGRGRARALLARLNIPAALWSLSPTTFSGGEQQRVNIARGFVHPWPALLLDEPTASLDGANRDTVLALIEEAKAGAPRSWASSTTPPRAPASATARWM
jgi:alpha-D-ribose 1-methylphosphonate 5-triphosphate synthase subunit PhnL